MDIERCGATEEGAIYRIRLRSCRLAVDILTLGGAITRLEVPDRDGVVANVVLAHDTVDAYRTNAPYFGVIVGRFANRIADGRFTIAGRTVELARNDAPHALHGGDRGFGRRLWQIRGTVGSHRLDLRHVSPDGEDGYPGMMTVDVTYGLTDDALYIEYNAECDSETIINLTNHSYFNLGDTQDILDHELTVDADHFLPVSADLIPTGELRAVEGTPFDLRQPVRLGTRLQHKNDKQLIYGRGFDHCWALRSPAPAQTSAILRDLRRGRTLELRTTEPGLQVYTGNRLRDADPGRAAPYQPHAGIALETQHYPDSVHHDHFPTVRLSPGVRYQSKTSYRFLHTA